MKFFSSLVRYIHVLNIVVISLTVSVYYVNQGLFCPEFSLSFFFLSLWLSKQCFCNNFSLIQLFVNWYLLFIDNKLICIGCMNCLCKYFDCVDEFLFPL